MAELVVIEFVSSLGQLADVAPPGTLLVIRWLALSSDEAELGRER